VDALITFYCNVLLLTTSLNYIAMDYSLRYLKRREIFPTKVAKVEWNQSKQMRSMTPMSERPSMKYSSHKPTTTPFFTRKMTQFVKKN
jgi:hypothetical protein